MTIRPLTPQEAADQAAEYNSFLAPVDIKIGDEVFRIPHPANLDDEQQERYDELQFRIEQCDKEPDLHVPKRTVTEADGSVVVTEAHSIPGERILIPYRMNGELLKPSYNVQLAIAIWGEEGYERYKAGGGRSVQIGLEWRRMTDEMGKRKAEDSKSSDGTVVLEAVPDSD